MPHDIEHYENKFKSMRTNLAKYIANECKGSNNKSTPDRCWSAKEYKKKVDEFMEKKINDSKLNTETKLLPLFQDRITKKSDIYPYNNYDYDYKTKAIRKFNIYRNSKYTGRPVITNRPTMDGLSDIISGSLETVDDLNKIKVPEQNSRKEVSGSNVDNAVVRNLIDILSDENDDEVSERVILRVNDRVLASYKGSKQKYPGVILANNGDNTYKIRFDEYQEYTYDDVIHDDVNALNLKKEYDKFPLPYPSFRTDYPESHYSLTGERASSYFIKNGRCFTPYVNEKLCKNKGFEWVPSGTSFNKDSSGSSEERDDKIPALGTCYKPRYIYINNESIGFFGKNGMVMSSVNDTLNLAPDKLLDVMSGSSVDGSGILPCPKEMFYPHSIYDDEDSTKNPFKWDYFTLHATVQIPGYYKPKIVRGYRWNIYTESIILKTHTDLNSNVGDWIFVYYEPKKIKQGDDIIDDPSREKILAMIKVHFDKDVSNNTSEYRYKYISKDEQKNLELTTAEEIWKEWNENTTKKPLKEHIPREACIGYTNMNECKAPYCQWDTNGNYCDNSKTIVSISEIFIDLINPGESSEKRYIVPDLQKDMLFESFTNHPSNLKLRVYNKKDKRYGCFVILLLFLIYYLLYKLLKN